MSQGDRDRDVQVSRRRFCEAAGLGACALTGGGALALSIDFLHPRVLFEPPTRFAAGIPEAFSLGDVITNQLYRTYVIRQADGFRALSSVCTHLGCMTRYQADEKVIACPCHGSRFSLEGEVLAGPALRGLRWFEMVLSLNGEIEVDTALEVPPGTVFKL